MSDNSPERIIRQRALEEQHAQQEKARKEREIVLRLLRLIAPKASRWLKRNNWRASLRYDVFTLTSGQTKGGWALASSVADRYGVHRNFHFLADGDQPRFIIQQGDANSIIPMEALVNFVHKTDDLVRILDKLRNLANLPNNELSPRRTMTFWEKVACFLRGI